MKILQRDKSRQMLGGVCAGVGNYLAIDTSVVRLLFVLATIFFGTGILAYIILWMVLPEGNNTYTVDANGMPVPNPSGYVPPYQPTPSPGMGHAPGYPYSTEPQYDNANTTGPLPSEQPGHVPPTAPRAGNGRLVVGGLLIAFGGLMLVRRFIPEFDIDPGVVVAIALVGLGALLVLRRR